MCDCGSCLTDWYIFQIGRASTVIMCYAHKLIYFQSKYGRQENNTNILLHLECMSNIYGRNKMRISSLVYKRTRKLTFFLLFEKKMFYNCFKFVPLPSIQNKEFFYVTLIFLLFKGN